MFSSIKLNFLEFIKSHPWLLLFCKTFYRAYKEGIFTSASSLTFSSIIAMVPLVTVVLSIFSAFPAFSQMQHTLESWLFNNLIPENIGQQVLEYTNQFAEHASRLGIISAVFLFISCLLLVSTIEESFNKIWHTKISRSIAQRILMYWSSITLFPILLALGISISSYIVYLSSDYIPEQQKQHFVFIAYLFEAALLMLASTAVFYFLPEAKVRFKHAVTGGVIVAIVVALAKKIWVIYYAIVPTYSLVYGTFVIIPLLLLWIYVLWLIVLLVAILVSLLPNLSLNPNTILHGTKGWKFKLACNILAQFHHNEGEQKFINLSQLAINLNTDAVYVRQIIICLIDLGLLGQLDDDSNENFILIINPNKTLAAPLINQFLISESNYCNEFWHACKINQLYISNII